MSTTPAAAKAKHTPGPWKIDRTRYDIFEIAAASESRWIAHVQPRRNFGETSEDANARLIAAAPDLLEACRTAAQELYDGAHSSGDPGDPTNMQSNAMEYRKCVAAIRKAEGEL